MKHTQEETRLYVATLINEENADYAAKIEQLDSYPNTRASIELVEIFVYAHREKLRILEQLYRWL